MGARSQFPDEQSHEGEFHRHYYVTHPEINPTRIVPLGPLLDLDRPHHRDRF